MDPSTVSDRKVSDDEKVPATATPGHDLESLPSGANEAAAIPKGTIDPVYEAKARVLNKAVGNFQKVSTRLQN
jgi:hypothetical protein